MTGAIPRSLMTASELADARLDDQRELDELEDTIFLADREVVHPAGESTGPLSPEGQNRPEGDATRAPDFARPGLLARRHLPSDDRWILAIGLVMCALAIAVIAASAEPGWF